MNDAHEIFLEPGTASIFPAHLGDFDELQVRGLSDWDWIPMVRSEYPLRIAASPRRGIPVTWAYLAGMIFINPIPAERVVIRGVKKASTSPAVDIPITRVVKTEDPERLTVEKVVDATAPLRARYENSDRTTAIGKVVDAMREKYGPRKMTRARLEALHERYTATAGAVVRTVPDDDLRDLISSARLYAVLSDATDAKVAWDLDASTEGDMNASLATGGPQESRWVSDRMKLPLDSFAAWLSGWLDRLPPAVDAPKPRDLGHLVRLVRAEAAMDDRRRAELKENLYAAGELGGTQHTVAEPAVLLWDTLQTLARSRMQAGIQVASTGTFGAWCGKNLAAFADLGALTRWLANSAIPAPAAPAVDREALIRKLEAALAGKGDSAMVRALSPAEAAALLEGLRATSK